MTRGAVGGRPKAAAVAVAVTAAVAGSLIMLPSTANAQVSGSCRGTIQGVDAARLSSPDRALPVNPLTPLRIQGETGGLVRQFAVDMEIAGVHWTLSEIATQGSSFKGQIQMQRYNWLSAGVFRVSAYTVQGVPCRITGFIKLVGRSPLATVAGGGAAVASVVGLLALLASSLAPRRRQLDAISREVWEQGRARQRPVVSVVGLPAGLAVAGGTLLLLHQYALVYPTGLIAGAAALAGLALGIGVPSLARSLVVRRANRDEAESQA